MIAPWPIQSRFFGSADPVTQQWLSKLVVAVNTCPAVISSVSTDTIQAASLTTTSFPFAVVPGQAVNTVPQGRYRVTYELRKTQAASSTSTLTTTIGWTDGSVTCSQVFAALTTNTTAAVQSGTVTINADKGTAITYAVAYGSTGGTVMQYRWSAFVETVPS